MCRQEAPAVLRCRPCCCCCGCCWCRVCCALSPCVSLCFASRSVRVALVFACAAFCVSVGPSAFYVCSCARSSTAAAPVKRESSPMTHQFVKAAVRGIQHPMPCYRRWGFARPRRATQSTSYPPEEEIFNNYGGGVI